MIRVPKDVTLINTNAGLTAGAIYGFSNRVKKAFLLCGKGFFRFFLTKRKKYNKISKNGCVFAFFFVYMGRRAKE
jgi:hypothetical protein